MIAVSLCHNIANSRDVIMTLFLLYNFVYGHTRLCSMLNEDLKKTDVVFENVCFYTIH